MLGGALSPIDGVDPENLHIAELLRRVDNGGGIREVVIATNATTTGEATALYLADALRERAPDVVVTRLASGLPSAPTSSTPTRSPWAARCAARDLSRLTDLADQPVVLLREQDAADGLVQAAAGDAAALDRAEDGDVGGLLVARRAEM